MSGMDDLGRRIAEGKTGFAEVHGMLVSAHVRLFGAPASLEGIQALENRISTQLEGHVMKAEWGEERTQLRSEQEKPRLLTRIREGMEW